MVKKTVKPKQSPTEDTTMDDARKTCDPARAHETFSQFTGKAVETMALWADANQRVLSQVVELSAGAAKESARLYSEMQQATVEALRDTQAAALRWQTTWPEAMKDPVRWYQQALLESVDTAQKALRLIEGNAQAVTRAAERVQASTEQAGKGLQETLRSVATKMKDVCSQN